MSKTKIRNAKTGAFALLDTLVRNSTHHIFGYPGGAILPIYDELYFWEKQNLLTHILTRHEQGAIHAADSYARVTGHIGVCMATSGPGATNLITGIANAQMDSVPLIIITGQVNSNFIGTDAFQETDIFGITLPIVKHSYKIIHPKDICKTISEAFYISQNGRPGPIIIDIPKDIGTQEIIKYKPFQQKEILKLQGYRFKYKINRQSILEALSLIREAERPILYVGGGVITSNSYKELFELAKIFLIPVTTTLMGKGAFDERDVLSIGMLGMHGTAYANFAVSECDLLIAVGARFDDRVTGKLDSFACLANIIHIDIDPAEIGKNKIVDISLIGDVKRIFQEILISHKWDWEEYSLPPKRILWLECISQWRRIYPLIIPKLQTKLSPQYVINSLGKTYPTAIFTTDVGQHQMWSAQFVKCGPRRWSTSSGLGTMGYGLPAAIGAQIAFPNEYIVCITGDSSFQMCLQELGTIAQNNLPIRIVIINNHWQGMVRQWQESFYGDRYSHSNMTQGQPNFISLANSYGIKGININDEKDLMKALRKYKDYYSPILFDCLVVENENCYPMVSPGATNAAMTGIQYKQDEIDLLKRHCDENDNITSFLPEVIDE
jgi:acetolactate synthase-1/2/3 large subunit